MEREKDARLGGSSSICCSGSKFCQWYVMGMGPVWREKKLKDEVGSEVCSLDRTRRAARDRARNCFVPARNWSR